MAASTEKHPLAYWYNDYCLKRADSDALTDYLQRNGYSLTDHYTYEDFDLMINAWRMENWKKGTAPHEYTA